MGPCSNSAWMLETAADSHLLLDALTEAALIAAGGRVVAANAAARALLGAFIEGSTLEQVVAHPAALQALERSHDSPDGVELTGLGGSRRHWLMRTAELADGTTLIRLVDRSESRA